jgi:TPR repeat protein
MKRWLIPSLVLVALMGVYLLYKEKSSNSLISVDDTAQIASSNDAPTNSIEASSKNIKATVKRKGPFMRQARGPVVGDGIQIIDQFKANALAGDGESAFMVFLVLYECGLQAKGLGGIGKIDCTGVTPEQIAESESFLKRAAELGVLEAQLSYAGVASMRYVTAEDIAKNIKSFEQYKADSMRYLSSAASTGNVDAMLSVSNAYSEGMIVEKNNVRAYAYMYAANLSGLSPTPTNALAELSANMNTSEIQQATALGKSIYSKCCN